MHLSNPRQSIHDAFAIHLTTSNGTGGGTKFDSNKWVAATTIAGLVISATLNQRPHLRGIAMLLNAPEKAVMMSDIVAIKSKVWADFVKAAVVLKITPAEQGLVVAHLDQIILGYKARVWNPESKAYIPSLIFPDVGVHRADRMNSLTMVVIDSLGRYDGQSLRPVSEMIREQREKQNDSNN